MSPRRAFDRFMVDNENGRNLKLMRLTDAEFRALVAGVWPIASKADVRGTFMVGRVPATAEDVANQSPKTSRRTAASLLDKLRDLGMLEFDAEVGGEWVHDWDILNPTPKADPTNAKRQAAYRARNATSNATGNGVHNATSNEPVTPPEVKKEKNPPYPPLGGGTGFSADFEEWLLDHQQVTEHQPPRAGTKARTALAQSYAARRCEGYDQQATKDATRGAHADDYRRERGYDTADSVLRPTKFPALVARGRMQREASKADDSFVARMAARGGA